MGRGCDGLGRIAEDATSKADRLAERLRELQHQFDLDFPSPPGGPFNEQEKKRRKEKIAEVSAQWKDASKAEDRASKAYQDCLSGK